MKKIYSVICLIVCLSCVLMCNTCLAEETEAVQTPEATQSPEVTKSPLYENMKDGAEEVQEEATNFIKNSDITGQGKKMSKQFQTIYGTFARAYLPLVLIFEVLGIALFLASPTNKKRRRFAVCILCIAVPLLLTVTVLGIPYAWSIAA